MIFPGEELLSLRRIAFLSARKKRFPFLGTFKRAARKNLFSKGPLGGRTQKKSPTSLSFLLFSPQHFKISSIHPSSSFPFCPLSLSHLLFSFTLFTLGMDPGKTGAKGAPGPQQAACVGEPGDGLIHWQQGKKRGGFGGREGEEWGDLTGTTTPFTRGQREAFPPPRKGGAAPLPPSPRGRGGWWWEAPGVG